MKKSILILLAIINVACGESDQINQAINQITEQNQETLFIKTSNSDCSEFGYTDTLFFTDNNSAGLAHFDEVNYITIAQISLNKNPYTVVYEFEDNPNSMWPTQSASFQAQYHEGFRILRLSDVCAYELQD